MGVVYRGQHTKLPREVAIKSINPRYGDNDLRSLRHRFEREAYIQSQLDHPGIVKIYDYIVAEQTYYIVMEYVEGRSLAQLLKQEEGRPLTCERALNLFDQILTAVTYAHTFTYQDQDGAAHRGIIHRDLKPPNILVTRRPRQDHGFWYLHSSSRNDRHARRATARRECLANGEGWRLTTCGLEASYHPLQMLTGAPPFGNEPSPERPEICAPRRHPPPPRPNQPDPP